jgi:hypothetical protein
MKNHFDITKIVSPSKYGGEDKNQDRVGIANPVLTKHPSFRIATQW